MIGQESIKGYPAFSLKMSCFPTSLSHRSSKNTSRDYHSPYQGKVQLGLYFKGKSKSKYGNVINPRTSIGSKHATRDNMARRHTSPHTLIYLRCQFGFDHGTWLNMPSYTRPRDQKFRASFFWTLHSFRLHAHGAYVHLKNILPNKQPNMAWLCNHNLNKPRRGLDRLGIIQTGIGPVLAETG